MIVTRMVKAFIADQRGATAIEYGLICGLLVLVMIVGFSGFANATKSTWGTVSTQMANAVSQSTGA